MTSRTPASPGADRRTNLEIAQRLLTGAGSGLEADVIAAMFARNVRIEIPGDDGVLPWIGNRSGRAIVADYIASARDLTDPLELKVEDVLASPSRAVIVGELAARIRSTEKVVETAFAIVLTVTQRRITRFQMLQDSFAVSLAARNR